MDCYIKVYGCQMNAADAHLVSRLLADGGIEEVEDSQHADAVVLLTCSVRRHAEDRAQGFARTMRGEGKKVIVAGCMGRLRGEELVKEGIADYVLGPDEYRKIPRILKDSEVSDTVEELETYSDLLPVDSGGVSASFAIMRGCNNYCTYCVVPFARGPERSVPYEALERQVKYLVDKGVKEVFLLGQNVLAYAHDDLRFADIVEKVSRIEGVERTGFLTSHPRDLDYEPVQRMADIPELLHFFHLPLQSASDKILGMMNRRYTISDYSERINWVRQTFPDAYLTTDILVGFPGETAEDFRMTLDALKRFDFDFAYMFAYSERPGTKAVRMASQEPKEERLRRLSEVIEVQTRITRRRAETWVGRNEDLFVTAPAPRRRGMLAEMKNHRSVILNHTARPGDFVQARLVGVKGWSVIAEPAVKEVV
ncbi:MiaB/RimO family radical SAM methylthiotransferase [candidate division WOR-3 bacterium]|uniref:tRNA-2-methylthio-N(6)-dimethylallyladenosine synthase n=1 Tax=candidate division WOR-3 bacterium TaxID=2052148 RepID=A0A9D5KCB6_UNCW3|nr:MiaB/RimO family radical SAM methylthiotransferase [candidate division WOR-3 bacterium]MBD3365440.1 MiaB/RimO family radical SAM methylthiotransferase [candidate division WOR-3 bacterium]